MTGLSSNISINTILDNETDNESPVVSVLRRYFVAQEELRVIRNQQLDNLALSQPGMSSESQGGQESYTESPQT